MTTTLNQTVKTAKTLTELGGLIRDNILKDVEDARLRELGAQIIKAYNVTPRDNRALARAFQLFAQRIKFFREFPEVNAAPWITAKWGIGDCDDKARLIAALCKSFRIPVRLAYVTFEKEGRRLSHVWPEAFVNNSWEALESVREWPMGKSALELIKAKGLSHKTFTQDI